MKRVYAVLLVMVLFISLCACVQDSPVAEPSEVTPPNIIVSTKNPEEIVENAAFADYAKGNAVGVILNEPFDGNEPTATVRWKEGEYERLYIIPRYVGSYIEVYQTNFISTDGDLVMFDDPVYSEKALDGCVIYSSLERPEGYCKYYVQITTPANETYGIYLNYNGNTGTPPMEYIGPET